MLLVRQATASQVRQPGESATSRSLETPHSYPLKTGLNVKDPGAPKWSGGKDGDLRDVWRRALSGSVDNDGKPTGQVGKVSTVLGKDEVIEHKLEKLTAEINAVGKHLRGRERKRVAIYLPNSVEFLVTFFGKESQYTFHISANREPSYRILRPHTNPRPSTYYAGKPCWDIDRDKSRRPGRRSRCCTLERAAPQIPEPQASNMGRRAYKQTHGLE